ncbi:MAG: MOSC domain-containing protein [Rhodobacteraceae bacterium]|nr:MOSC domain-containing protein [Paracoccaceae bacterium]
MGTLADIYRHPIKAHGSELLESVTLAADHTLPWDRVWAVAHEKSKSDGSEWARCGNFSRGAHVPTLMAVTCSLDEATGTVTLRHPELADLTADPDSEGSKIIDWIAGVMPPEARRSTAVVRAQSAAQGQGMTDNPNPYVSILSHASLRALSQKAGRELSPLRFRGNLWVEGLAPWEEFEWVGKTIRIGAIELAVEDRIDRCPATTVDPATGRRDTPTLDLLQEGWGHIDFGVFARVISAGPVNVGDAVEMVG